MSLTILAKHWRRVAGQNGYLEFDGIAQFAGTETTNELECDLSVVTELGELMPIGSAAGKTNQEQIPLGALSATAAFTFLAPAAGVITGVNFLTATADAAAATNYWSFGLVNKTQTLTPVNSATTANTTNTGGSSITAYSPLALTLAASVQLVCNANDVYEFTATKTGAPSTLNESLLAVTFALANGSDESLWYPESSQIVGGRYLRPSKGTITINRSSQNPTSQLMFFFRYRGY